MAASPHTFAPAQVWIGLTGSSISYLGETIDGVDNADDPRYEDIKTDSYGDIAYDVQYMGVEAKIVLDMVLYDSAVLATVTGYTSAGTDGVQLGAGVLMVAQTKTFRVCIKPLSGGPGTSENAKNYPQCVLVAHTEKVGTRKTVLHLEFRALTAQNPGNMAGQVYRNTTSS